MTVKCLLFREDLKEALRLAASHGTPGRAAKLAVVVGTLLVLINQWEAVVGASSMDWVKVALTYCVPYMVSTYTSVSKDLHLRRQAETARAYSMTSLI